MTVSQGLRASWLLIPATLLVLLTLAPAGQAQPQGRPAGPEGTEIFRRILFEMGLKPLDDRPEGLVDEAGVQVEPSKTILIILGNPVHPSLRDGAIRNLLERGGAILLASDQKVSDPKLEKELIELTGCTIAGETFCYKGRWEPNPPIYHNFEQCPILVPRKGVDPNLFPIDQSRENQMLQVATNRPSCLKKSGDGVKPPFRDLASLPPDCFPELIAFEERRLSPSGEKITFWVVPDGQPFAVGGSFKKGRLLLLADHSLFINMMMSLPDIDNVEFASNCLDYLRGPSEAPRTHVLFLEEGLVNKKFDVPLKQIPGLSEKGLRAILASLEDRLARLEDQDAFNQGILNLKRQRFPNLTTGHVMHFTILVLTAVLLACALWRFRQLRGVRPEQAVPLLAEAIGPAALPGGGAPVSLLEHRQQELLKTGNLWENGRQVARQMFLSAGISAPADPLRAPSIEVAGTLWQRWQRRHQVLRLWRLAFDPRPFRVRPDDWPNLLAQLEQLQADIASGSVQVKNAA